MIEPTVLYESARLTRSQQPAFLRLRQVEGRVGRRSIGYRDASWVSRGTGVERGSWSWRPRSLPGRSVQRLAQHVEVTDVPRGLLQHVHQHEPQ